MALGQILFRVSSVFPWQSLFPHCSIPGYHRTLRCAIVLIRQHIIIFSVFNVWTSSQTRHLSGHSVKESSTFVHINCISRREWSKDLPPCISPELRVIRQVSGTHSRRCYIGCHIARFMRQAVSTLITPIALNRRTNLFPLRFLRTLHSLWKKYGAVLHKLDALNLSFGGVINIRYVTSLISFFIDSADKVSFYCAVSEVHYRPDGCCRPITAKWTAILPTSQSIFLVSITQLQDQQTGPVSLAVTLLSGRSWFESKPGRQAPWQ
jgi:hypothetical protein